MSLLAQISDGRTRGTVGPGFRRDDGKREQRLNSLSSSVLVG
jgi:hypothetical protein